MVWLIVPLPDWKNSPTSTLRFSSKSQCVQFPGRFTRKQYKTLVRRVSLYAKGFRARKGVLGPRLIVGSAINRVV